MSIGGFGRRKAERKLGQQSTRANHAMLLLALAWYTEHVDVDFLAVLIGHHELTLELVPLKWEGPRPGVFVCVRVCVWV
ncbi:hypothetical protein PoB_002342200 [Plakobranchus ocellatus]|uniref:Uncharacterized protein n=1 Tax=Plakobranchus ocellatus TaxID=259542 RepID=A0AAV3ZNY2_9GAST|nr:hypothetical protein PoB_002342200 [Plakobranchus ocellatus]